MAVTLVEEDVDGRGGSLVADRREREYTRQFTVYTNSRLDGPKVVGSAAGIPRLWTPYASGNDLDLGSWCRAVEPQKTDNPLIWKVVCKYSSRLERPDLAQVGRPEMRPPKISWHT